jgi:hypothetical protein
MKTREFKEVYWGINITVDKHDENIHKTWKHGHYAFMARLEGVRRIDDKRTDDEIVDALIKEKKYKPLPEGFVDEAMKLPLKEGRKKFYDELKTWEKYHNLLGVTMGRCKYKYAKLHKDYYDVLEAFDDEDQVILGVK